MPRGKTRDGEPHGAIDLERRHAEQARFFGIDAQIQVGAQQPRRIVHVARARRRFEDLLDLIRDAAQALDLRTDDANRHGRIDRRSLLKLLQGNARGRIVVESRAQCFEQLGRALGIEGAQFDEHLAQVGRPALREIIVVNERRAVTQVRIPALDFRDARRGAPRRNAARDRFPRRSRHPEHRPG